MMSILYRTLLKLSGLYEEYTTSQTRLNLTVSTHGLGVLSVKQQKRSLLSSCLSNI